MSAARRRRPPSRDDGPAHCSNHVIAAALWPLYGVNLGTLLRTCDAVGACLAVPRLAWVPRSLERGNTLRRQPCVHWISEPPEVWLREQHTPATHVIGAERTPQAIRLADLAPARRRTVVVLGHEQTGIPPEALDALDTTVTIPMIGIGHSLNVAVAGSLLLYRLTGLI